MYDILAFMLHQFHQLKLIMSFIISGTLEDLLLIPTIRRSGKVFPFEFLFKTAIYKSGILKNSRGKHQLGNMKHARGIGNKLSRIGRERFSASATCLATN